MPAVTFPTPRAPHITSYTLYRPHGLQVIALNPTATVSQHHTPHSGTSS